MCEAFLHRFTLSKQDIVALKDGDFGKAFFDALAKLKTIHHDCHLLTTLDHQQIGYMPVHWSVSKRHDMISSSIQYI